MSSNLIYSQYILIYLSWCIYPHLSILIYPCILIYLSILICSYSILIHSHLFSSFWILIISSHLFLSPLISSHFLICSHLFSFVPISSDHVLSCSNLVSLVSFVLTCSHLSSSIIIYSHPCTHPSIYQPGFLTGCWSMFITTTRGKRWCVFAAASKFGVRWVRPMEIQWRLSKQTQESKE